MRSSPAIVASWMPSNRHWIESLSPWPEEFGLGRMERLLEELGEPQRAFPAIHIVGTNGKTTTAGLLEALLDAEGLAVGTYTSPHVLGWEERIRIGAEPVDFEAALGRIRPAAEAIGATQFEALTAAAFAEFAAAAVDVAVVEAGLGGRLDATNVIRAPVVVLTNVALEHTEVLGTTREAIAAEKLAVVSPGAVVVLGEPEWEATARARARRRRTGPRCRRRIRARGRRICPCRRSRRGRVARRSRAESRRCAKASPHRLAPPHRRRLAPARSRHGRTPESSSQVSGGASCRS